jgi:hypothetical protein
MKAPTARAPLDRYDTAPWMTEVLLREVPEIGGRLLLVPCSGNGQMAAQLAPRFGRVITNDVDPKTPARSHRDACRRVLWELCVPDWTIDNPPFVHAGIIGHNAIDYSVRGVALLLPITFSEVCRKREWLTINPPRRLLVLPRHRFRGQGTDRVTLAWHVWSLQPLQGPPILCLPKDAPRLYAPRILAPRGVQLAA